MLRIKAGTPKLLSTEMQFGLAKKTANEVQYLENKKQDQEEGVQREIFYE
jgi:hypothetical protein